jgi:hypothetical protein
MPWKVAESLDQLLHQLDDRAPDRSKASDGAIGDGAHMSRSSDHNPWLVLDSQRLVTARDFTHDPEHGLSCADLARELREGRDSRIKYVIWNRQIMSGADEPSPWLWRSYNGANPHNKHLHLSVVADVRCRDTSPWLLGGQASGGAGAAALPALDVGSSGPAVLHLQQFLKRYAPSYAGGLVADGAYGPNTAAVVREYQWRAGLPVVGRVGPQTKQALWQAGYRG